MRVFAKPSGLERLSLEARIVYSGFCMFMLLGYASTVWFYVDDHLDTSPRSARTYYLGDTQAGVQAEPGGPVLELPAEHAAMAFAKSPRQVMETFHFHLFSVSVCLLVLAHLFMMCGLPTPIKAAVIALAWLATLAHLLTPPLIRCVSAAWSPMMFPSAAAMALSWCILTAWPLVEMWRPSARRRTPPPDQATS